MLSPVLPTQPFSSFTSLLRLSPASWLLLFWEGASQKISLQDFCSTYKTCKMTVHGWELFLVFHMSLGNFSVAHKVQMSNGKSARDKTSLNITFSTRIQLNQLPTPN
uniref:Uncharacterized protein n=1 Tax=Sphaerodactylus townsendi TaxID=933632 RepID=A0ACB8G265_9SAUR